MHGNQPLTSVQAFALALVEASSRISATAAPNDVVETPIASEDLIPAAD